MLLRSHVKKIRPVCSACRFPLAADKTPIFVFTSFANVQTQICEKCDTQPPISHKRIRKTQPILQLSHIDIFSGSRPKHDNNMNNVIREQVIDAIINGAVPSSYYASSSQWQDLKTQVDAFLHLLNGDKPYSEVKCENKGGRKYKYDFVVSIKDAPDAVPIIHYLEFKFNATTIKDAPQFVSPSNPSAFLEYNYAEYFYDEYLPILAEHTNLPIPPKPIYLAQIHSPRPKCMVAFQDKYYRGCAGSSQYSGDADDAEFHALAKRLSADSITEFIAKYDLDYQKLSEYLAQGQLNKTYMLYEPTRGFKLERQNTDDFRLLSAEKKGNKYLCVCASGHKLTVLLRWKNGNGIAFPAFQIQMM